MNGLHKAIQLAFNLSSPFRTSGWGVRWGGRRMKRWMTLNCSEFLLLERELNGASLSTPSVWLPWKWSPTRPHPILFPISHQYQLAVPHIRGRMGPSQWLLLCTKMYPGEQHSQRRLTYEWETTEELRETGSGTHFWTQAEMQIWGLSMPFSQPCKLAHVHLPGAWKETGGGGGGAQGIPICCVSPSIDFWSCFSWYLFLWMPMTLRWLFVFLTWASGSRCGAKEMS